MFFKFLDNVNLILYLSDFKDKKVWELMDKLEEDLPYKDEYSETLFDAVDQYEFMDYLIEKYHANFYEVEYYCLGNINY